MPYVDGRAAEHWENMLAKPGIAERDRIVLTLMLHTARHAELDRGSLSSDQEGLKFIRAPAMIP